MQRTEKRRQGRKRAASSFQEKVRENKGQRSKGKALNAGTSRIPHTRDSTIGKLIAMGSPIVGLRGSEGGADGEHLFYGYKINL